MRLVEYEGKFAIERGWIDKEYLDIGNGDMWWSSSYSLKHGFGTEKEALAAFEKWKKRNEKIEFKVVRKVK